MLPYKIGFKIKTAYISVWIQFKIVATISDYASLLPSRKEQYEASHTLYQSNHWPLVLVIQQLIIQYAWYSYSTNAMWGFPSVLKLIY